MKSSFNKFAKFIMIVSTIVVCFVNVLNPVSIANAVVNKQINYQGKLTNASNVAVANGLYSMEFKLYTAPTGGSPIWTETLTGANEVQVTSGLFSIMLGSTTPFTGVDFNQTLYLGVNIEGDGEMSPRKILGAVPAAFVADTIDGVSSEQLVRNDTQNATSSSSTFLNVLQSGAGKIAEFFGTASQSVLSLLSNGNVGVGTTTPSNRLEVNGNGYFSGNVTAFGTSSLANLIIEGGTGGNSNKIIFKTSDNGDLSKYIGTVDYWTTIGVHGNEGLRVVDNNDDVLFQVNGLDGNTGFVGIGTPDPQSALHVNSNGLSEVKLGEYGRGDGALSLWSGADEGYQTITAGDQAIYVSTRIELPSISAINELSSNLFAGNVGIGTTSPSEKLSVAGNGYFTGNLTAANITATGTLSVTGKTTLGNASTTNLTISGNLNDSANSQGALGYVLQSTGTSTRWVATSTLGITQDLSGYVPYTGATTGLNLGSQTLTTTGQTSLGNASTTALSVSGQSYFLGNVGIGTSTPQGILHVATSSTATTGIIVQAGSSAGSNTHFFKQLWGNGSNAGAIGTQGSSWNNFGIWGPGANLSGTPNLAIGNSEIGVNVQLRNTTGILTLKGNTSSGNPDVLAVSSAADRQSLRVQAFAGHTADIFQVSSSTASTLYFNVSGTGNVGIGTTSPSNKLEVAGNAFVGGNITATGTGVFSGNVGIGVTSPQYLLDLGNAYIESDGSINLASGKLTVTTDSYRPIMTMYGVSGPGDPATAFDIRYENITVASINYAGAITGSSIIKSGGSSNEFLKADGSVDLNTYLTTGTAGSTYVPYTGATTGLNLGSQTLITTGQTSLGNASTTALSVSGQSYFAGNVGVGTTSPSSILSVVSSDSVASTNILSVFSNDGISGLALRHSSLVALGTGQSITITPGTGGVVASAARFDIGSILTLSGINAFTSSAVRLNNSSPINWFSGGTWASGSADIGLVRDSAGILRVTNGSTGGGSLKADFFTATSTTGTSTFAGNVGIGTTSPYEKLSVAGNGYFSGNLTAANITATGTLSVTGNTTLGNASTTNLTSSDSIYITGLSSSEKPVVVPDADGKLITPGWLYIEDFYNKVTIRPPVAPNDVNLHVLRGDADNSFAEFGIGTGTVAPSWMWQMKMGDTGLYFMNNIGGETDIWSIDQSTKTTNYLQPLRLSSSLKDSYNSAGTIGQILQSTGTSTRWVATSTLGITQDLSGYVPYTGATTGLNLGSQTLTTTGQTSLGNASTTALSVSGQSYLLNNVSVGTSTITSASINVLAQSGSAHLRLIPYSSGNVMQYSALVEHAGNIVVGPKWGDAASPYNIYYNDGSGLSILNAWSNSMLTDDIYRTLGNVGIGTTSPSNKLEVSGNGYFSGNLTAANITATGTLSVLGNTTLGNASTTALSVSGNLYVTSTSTTGSILPAGSYTNNISNYTLGSSGARWNQVWADTLNLGTSTWSLKTNGANRLGFFNSSNGGGVEIVSLLGNSNVAIGTTTSQQNGSDFKLSVHNDVSGQQIANFMNSDFPNKYLNIETDMFGGEIGLMAGELGGSSRLIAGYFSNNDAIGIADNLITASLGNSLVEINSNSTSIYGNTTLTNASTTNLTISGNLNDSANSQGALGYVLQSTGTSTIWVATSTLGITGGSASPAGSNTQIQFNNSGSFGASANLTWDGTKFTTTNASTTNLSASGFLNVTGKATLALASSTHLTASNNIYISGNRSATNGYLEFTGTASGNFAALSDVANNMIIRSYTSSAKTAYGQIRLVPTGGGWTDNNGGAYIQTHVSGGSPAYGQNAIWLCGTYAADTACGRVQYTSRYYQHMAGTSNIFGSTPVPTASLEVLNHNVNQVNLKIKAQTTGGTQTADFVQVHNASNVPLFEINVDGSTLSTNYVASSTTAANVFPNASTTNLTASGELTLSGLALSTTGNYLCIDTTTNKVTSGTSCTLSSMRFKDNVQDLDIGLQAVLALKPVTFEFTQGYGDNGETTQLGFIAEQAESIDSRLVPHDKDGLPSGFNYANYTAVLTKAIQEQQQQIDALQDSLNSNTSSSDSNNDEEVLAKIEEMQIKVDSLTATVANIDIDLISTSTIEVLASSTPLVTSVANKVSEIVSSMSEWVVSKITATIAIFTEVKTEKLEVGSASKPSGVILYDEANGKPYCLKIVNGAISASEGDCASEEVETDNDNDSNTEVVVVPPSNTTVITSTSTDSDVGTTTVTTVISTSDSDAGVSAVPETTETEDTAIAESEEDNVSGTEVTVEPSPETETSSNSEESISIEDQSSDPAPEEESSPEPEISTETSESVSVDDQAPESSSEPTS